MEKSSTCSLSEARKKKLKVYFTGVPCKRNHLSLRRVSDRACLECKKLLRGKSDSKYREKNREAIKLSMTIYRKNNRELTNKRAAISRQKAYLRDPDKIKALRKAQTALRKARELSATPKWANLEAIKSFYLNCQKGMHVDHIIPLVNPLVCGLHTEDNLQYLTKKENLEKGNSFTPSH